MSAAGTVDPAVALAEAGASAPTAATFAALRDAADLAALAPLWASVMTRQVGAVGVAVLAVQPEPAVEPHARDAAGNRGPAPRQLQTLARVGNIPLSDFEAVATAVLETGRGVIRSPSRTDEDNGGRATLAQPVIVEGNTVAVAALALAGASPPALRGAMRALEWGLAWLRDAAATTQRHADSARLDALAAAHTVFAATLEASDFRAAALRVATALAPLAGADRVSIGFRRHGRSAIVAVSHSAEFGRRLSLNRQVADAMDEALDQRAALTVPPPEDDPNATRAHAALSRRRESAAILTVPFRAADAFVGAATLERPTERPFSPEEVARLDFVIALAGAALAEKHAADRTLLAVARDAAWAHLKRLFGPRHPGRKAALAVLLMLCAVLATWTGPYRVNADAVVEGALERSLAAPWEGFLLEAPVRAGDNVAEGDLIAALDDAELALERLRWETERREHAFEYRRALNAGERAEAEIRRARAEGAAARIALLDGQIARARITAPFDGIIVSGDRSQEIGAAVERGETLFEIAPRDDYRLALYVDEARIGDVTVGASGELVATSLPGQAFALEIVKITPVAAPREGRNAFRVEAMPKGPTDTLRPGMEGVAKIDVDERLRVEIWTRALMDWARLTFWRWFG